ncbi:OmpA/MotB family protein [Nonlabens ponticola]|uniref:OmpA family protein n=1 Tax=Nonlabens ponticola TaxID=2496866 RepID=A0A3S9MU70_9FLAO|nr:OmpA family protein [Nonlabens ponticola]AZQ42711.1 OmpA family protein [Nonlabens ponticola]AZQ45102.1 OmpA family protein [Nonlabens ponticola]
MKNYPKVVAASLVAAAMTVSCVSKKKYTELENDYNNTRSELVKTRVAKEDLEARFEAIEQRVDRYNEKIASLQASQEGMMVKTADGDLVLSDKNKAAMRRTLQNVPSEKLSGATTLKDSVNLAISYKMSQRLSGVNEGKNIDMKIENTVVMIEIADEMLFNDSSYRVGNKADDILEKIAQVVNSEPSLEVLIEGHTDSRTVREGSYIKDNWDLSTERAAAIARRLSTKFEVPNEQLIVAGRASYDPVAANDSNENRARNRRTQIIIMPDLDKFFGMLESETQIVN